MVTLLKTKGMPEIENNLGKLRQQRGFSAIQLAALVDVSRQTIYAMESGTYVPNTALALKLAKALGVKWAGEATKYLYGGERITWETYVRRYIEHYG